MIETVHSFRINSFIETREKSFSSSSLLLKQVRKRRFASATLILSYNFTSNKSIGKYIITRRRKITRGEKNFCYSCKLYTIRFVFLSFKKKKKKIPFSRTRRITTISLTRRPIILRSTDPPLSAIVHRFSSDPEIIRKQLTWKFVDVVVVRIVNRMICTAHFRFGEGEGGGGGGGVIDLPQVLSGKLEDTWNKNSVNLAITSPSLISIYSSTCERHDKRGRKVTRVCASLVICLFDGFGVARWSVVEGVSSDGF